MAENAYVIIGGGLAAGKAVETLRGEGYDGALIVVTDDDTLPYERPPLSKGILLGNDEPSVAILHDDQWYSDHNVEVRMSTRATGLDPAAHEVRLDDGNSLAYSKLLLATGARAKQLKLPGALYLRTLDQCLTLLERLTEGGNVVIVGAGWIGLEVAAAARHHGCEVVVVEAASGSLAVPLGPEMGRVFTDLHREHGVEFRFGRTVRTSSKDEVVLDDGTELPVDTLVVGIGVTPNTELAAAAGIECDDGILADPTLRTSDPDVFVAGDAARWQHALLNTRVRVEHWANAQDSGEAVARSMLGQDVTYDVLPFFFSDQYDLGMEFSGYLGPDGYDNVVVRGDLDRREFIAYWLRHDRVIAGMNVNVWDVQDDIQSMIRNGASAADIPQLY